MTLKDHIQEAAEKGIAIGHFNISNLELFHGIIEASKRTGLPVIIGVSEGERDFVGIHEAVALVKTAREKMGLPVFLNADHSYSLERVISAVDAGFDAVIFDGMEISHEENIEQTKKAVEYARSSGRDVIVEAELGNIGKSSKLLDEIPEGAEVKDEALTKAHDAAEFVRETGVDLLAPAIGNIHGMLKNAHNPKINIERIREIRESTGVPLVLHGGSGITDEEFVEAAKAGVAIIHINTELRVAYGNALRASLSQNPEEIAPYKYLKMPLEAAADFVERRLKLFAGVSN